MTTFAIGEVAILQKLTLHAAFNGMQVIIESSPYKGVYAMDFPGFEQWTSVHRRNLRKIDPPTTDTSEIRQATLDVIERAARRGATSMMFSDDKPSRRDVQQDARKQASARGRRAQRDIARYNAALRLFLVDDQLKRLVDAYCGMRDPARGELARAAERLLADSPRPAEVRALHPAVARGAAVARSVVAP